VLVAVAAVALPLIREDTGVLLVESPLGMRACGGQHPPSGWPWPWGGWGLAGWLAGANLLNAIFQ